jgi:hypothetical protein
MSCCIFLVLDFTGKSAFDPEKVRNCLRHLPGVRNWDENDAGYQFFCDFDFAGDTTIVNMPEDSPAISVEGMGDASLQVALEIQRRYGEEIYAISETCSFCIPLSTVSSLADFNDKIVSGFGREKLERRNGDAATLRCRQGSETMSRLPQYLSSPNFWVGVSSVVAATGIALCTIGFAAGLNWLTTVGLWLVAPILIGGVFIALVVVPRLIAANRKQRK